MFSGKVKQTGISKRAKKKRGRREVLAKAKAERAERERGRQRARAALRLTTWVRSVRAQRAFRATQRAHLDALLRDAGMRFQRLQLSGQPYVSDVEGELTGLIRAYTGISRRARPDDRTAPQDWARLCNLGRLVLASCASADPKRNVRSVACGVPADAASSSGSAATESHPQWQERLHFLCRSALFYISLPKFRRRPEAIIPVRVLSSLLSTPTGADDHQGAGGLAGGLARSLSRRHARGPTMLDVLVELVGDRDSVWLMSAARSMAVNALSASIVSEFSGGFATPATSSSSTTHFDNLARACLVRPLMSHDKEMYALILEPLLQQGGVHFWRGTLHAALRMVANKHGQRNDDISTLERVRLAANVITVTSGLLPGGKLQRPSSCRLSEDIESLATYVRLLAHIIPKIPTNMLVSAAERSLRQSSAAASTGGSSSDDDDVVYVGEAKSNSRGDSIALPSANYDRPIKFAPAQEYADDPAGAAARLLRGIDFTDALRRGIAIQRRGLPLANMGEPGQNSLPVGCAGIEMLVTPAHANMLFDSILPPSNSSPGADGPASGGVASASDRADTVLALASLYDSIFTRLDILRTKPTELLPPPGAGLTLINGLAFDPRLNLITRLWQALKTSVNLDRFAKATHLPSAITSLSSSSSSSSSSSPPSSNSSSSTSSSPISVFGTDAIESAVCLLCTCFSHLLLSLTDIDVYELGRPFSVPELERIVRFLGALLHRICWDEEPEHIQPPFFPTRRLRLLVAATKLFNQLYERNCRRPFCARELFLWSDLPLTEFHKAAIGVGGVRPAQMAFRAVLLLSSLPQTVAFDERVAVFEQLLANDRENGGHHHDIGPRTQVRVRRDHAVQDAMQSLPHDSVTLKHRVQITFVDSNGNTEAGIDGGGLFKEFVDVVTKEAFR